MKLPFYLGSDEESHYRNLGSLAHTHCENKGPLKVLALGFFQGAYWHKAFPQDLLFNVDAFTEDETVLEPSYTTTLKTTVSKSYNRELGIAPGVFDVVVCTIAYPERQCMYEDMLQSLAPGGVLCVLDLVGTVRTGVPIIHLRDGFLTTRQFPNVLPWLENYALLETKHFSMLPSHAYTPVDGAFPKDSAPVLYIANKLDIPK